MIHDVDPADELFCDDAIARAKARAIVGVINPQKAIYGFGEEMMDLFGRAALART